MDRRLERSGTRGVLLASVAWLAVACAPTIRPTVSNPGELKRLMAQFWVEPGSARDLAVGPWGAYAPDPKATYTLHKRETGGFSPKLEVTGPDGTTWSVKMGDEAQSEVTSSRIVWAVGYHQPPSYYVRLWRIKDEAGVHPMGPARFRPKLKAIDSKGTWPWHHNPFVGTPPYQGLLVLMMILNSTDLKDENNGLYELKKPHEGAQRWFTVKDLGATLGQTGRLYPKRNDIGEFEKQAFLESPSGEYVRFVFKGRHQELLQRITAEDVRWMCERLRRLTDRQWADAFSAGGYEKETADRYIRKIREKIDQGLSLSGGAR